MLVVCIDNCSKKCQSWKNNDVTRSMLYKTDLRGSPGGQNSKKLVESKILEGNSQGRHIIDLQSVEQSHGGKYDTGYVISEAGNDTVCSTIPTRPVPLQVPDALLMKLPRVLKVYDEYENRKECSLRDYRCRLNQVLEQFGAVFKWDQHTS